MYYYVNILLTKNALNTFISNENNFVQNQLLRSADSISFSFIPVAYSALLCWSPASIDFNGAALNSFFQCVETRRSLDNAAIMSRPRTLSVSGMNGGVGWPGLRASAWWLEGLSKDCISFWLTAILYYKSHWHWSYSSSVPSRKCSRKTNCCNLFLGICLVKLLANFHHTFHPDSLFQFNLIPIFRV